MAQSKIILQLFLIATILSTLSFLPGPAAGGPTASMTIWSNTYAGPYIIDPALEVGTEFVIDVQAILPPIVSSTDGGANGFDVVVRYNSTILNTVAVSYKAPLCPQSDGCRFSSGFMASNGTQPGIARLVVVLLGTPIDGQSILFRIRFRVVGTGITIIDILDGATITDPLLKFVDGGSLDGSWQLGEAVVLDSNSDNKVSPGEKIIAGIAQVGADLSVDPLIQVIDDNLDAAWTDGESVVYDDIVTNGKYDDGELVIDGPDPLYSQLTGPVGGQIKSLPYTSTDGYFDNTPPIGLSVNPASGTILPGQSISTDVSVTDLWQGFPETVSLSASGLPTGVTYTLVPDLAVAPFTSELTLTTDQTTPLGSYPITITATSDTITALGLTIQTTFTLDVAYLDYTITLSLASVSLAQGQSASTTVTVSKVSGGDETVSLTIEGLTSDLTATFEADSGTPTFATQLTITASQTATLSTIPLTVKGTSGDSSTTKTATLSATIVSGHDIAVTDVSIDKNVVNPGGQVQISAVVKNNGVNAETFTVTITAGDYASGTITIRIITGVTLTPGETRTVGATWTTTSVLPKTYEITVEVTRLPGETNTGDNTLTKSQAVRINAAPSADYTYAPTAPTAGASVSFDVSSSGDTDGTVASYSWNFGDGTTATGRTASHTFQSAGAYRVVLTVTDNDGGERTVEKTVTVTAAPIGIGPLIFSGPGLAGIGLAAALIVALTALLIRRRGKPQL